MQKLLSSGFLMAMLVLAGCAAKSGSQAEIQAEPLSEKALVHYDIAFDSYARGDLIPALGAALRAKELSPQNAEARNLLGLIYFRQGKGGLAEIEFKKAIELDPRISEGFNNLGSLYLSQKRYAEARDILMKGQENPLYLYPERMLNNLGLAYAGLNDKVQAQNAFLESIKFNPNFYLPHMNLGRLYFEEDNLSKAEPLLATASKLCRECSEPKYLLGKLFLKTDRAKEAVASFKQGSTVDPEGYFGKLCQQYLVQK